MFQTVYANSSEPYNSELIQLFLFRIVLAVFLSSNRIVLHFYKRFIMFVLIEIHICNIMNVCHTNDYFAFVQRKRVIREKESN